MFGGLSRRLEQLTDRAGPTGSKSVQHNGHCVLEQEKAEILNNKVKDLSFLNPSRSPSRSVVQKRCLSKRRRKRGTNDIISQKLV